MPGGCSGEARSGLALAAVPLETQVRRAGPRPCPTSPGTCRAPGGRTCAHLVPGSHGRSPRRWTQLPPPSPPGPQPRPPPTFGFLAPPELPLRLGNHLKPRPRPAPTRPESARPRLCARAGSPASAAHAGVRAWGGKPTPPSVFCACPRTGRGRRRLRGALRSASSWATQGRAGREGPGPGTRLISPALMRSCCGSSQQTFIQILAHLIFILLDSHSVRAFLLGLFQASPFQGA